MNLQFHHQKDDKMLAIGSLTTPCSKYLQVYRLVITSKSEKLQANDTYLTVKKSKMVTSNC